MNVGEITATIKATAEAFKTVINGVKKDIQDIAKETKEQAQKANQAVNDVANGSKKVADGTKAAISELAAISITADAAFYGMVRGIQDVITVTNQFNNSLLGLKSTSSSMNIDLKATTEAAQKLAEDGLMTVGEASTGLKNLLLSGFGLDQAITLMNRFKDSAAFGRQGALSFGEAIVSATEGIKNGELNCPYRRQLLYA